MKRILTLTLLCGTLFCHAQTSPAPAAETATPTVETLSNDVQHLKEEASAWKNFLARMPKISGYLQLGYEWSDQSSTFFIKRARLNFAGDILRNKLDYRLQLEFASTPKIVDAYLRYRPFNELNFQVGEYKVPFSIENTDYTPVKAEMIEYPLSLRKLMGFNDICGLSATGRDMGASVFGGFIRREGFSVINYDFGVFNGEGINLKDENKSKDFVGRLTIKPVRGLSISGSYYWGEYGDKYRKRIRYTAGANYDRGRIVLRSEWIGGVTGMLSESGMIRDLTSDGWYALGGFRAHKNLMIALRYDTFRMDVNQADSRQTNYTAGLLWQPMKFLRCQLNYTYENFAIASIPHRNVVAVMLSGIF